jgi:hypothetical protein
LTDLAGAMARAPTTRLGALQDRAALVALFLLYTNALVVAVTFHGIPGAVGVVVPALLCIPVARAAILRGEAIVITPAVPWMLLFIAIQFLGALFARYPGLAIEGVVVSATEGLLLYVLITNAIRTRPMLQGAIWTLVAAGALLGAIGVFQRITLTFGNTYFGFAQASPEGRLSGPLGDPNYYAQIMAALLPLAFFAHLSSRSRLERVLILSAGLLITAGVAFTFSRGAAVSLGLVLLLMVATGTIRVRYACSRRAVAPGSRTRTSPLGDASPRWWPRDWCSSTTRSSEWAPEWPVSTIQSTPRSRADSRTTGPGRRTT